MTHGTSGYRWGCRCEECRRKTNEYNRNRYNTRPDVRAKVLRDSKYYKLKDRYDLSKEGFLRLLVRQDSCCSICAQLMFPPYVDHDHITGKVRGLVCIKCNAGLGMFNDSTSLVTSALAYLTKADDTDWEIGDW